MLIGDIQEFQSVDETVIAKEVVIYYTNLDMTETVMMRKPYNIRLLIEEDRKQVCRNERNYLGLKWAEGVCQYAL